MNFHGNNQAAAAFSRNAFDSPDLTQLHFHISFFHFQQFSSQLDYNQTCVCVRVPIQASDPDLGASGQVHYRLVNHQKLFSINASGAIRTEVPLDREVGQGDVLGSAVLQGKRDGKTVELCCPRKGQRPLLPDRGGLGRRGGPAQVQADAVRHRPGRGRQQSCVRATELQRQHPGEQPQRQGHPAAEGEWRLGGWASCHSVVVFTFSFGRQKRLKRLIACDHSQKFILVI